MSSVSLTERQSPYKSRLTDRIEQISSKYFLFSLFLTSFCHPQSFSLSFNSNLLLGSHLDPEATQGSISGLQIIMSPTVESEGTANFSWTRSNEQLTALSTDTKERRAPVLDWVRLQAIPRPEAAPEKLFHISLETRVSWHVNQLSITQLLNSKRSGKWLFTE